MDWNPILFDWNLDRILNSYSNLDITIHRRVGARTLIWKKKWKEGFRGSWFQFEGKN
jgi:hypothetical protein